MINILNTDREYGRQLLSKLETQTQTPLFEELVGSEFSSGLPKTVSFNTLKEALAAAKEKSQRIKEKSQRIDR